MVNSQPQAPYHVREAERDDATMLDVLRAALRLIQESERATLIDDQPLAARQARREAHTAINALAQTAQYCHDTRVNPRATPGERHSALVSVGRALETLRVKLAQWYAAENTWERRALVQGYIDAFTEGH